MTELAPRYLRRGRTASRGKPATRRVTDIDRTALLGQPDPLAAWSTTNRSESLITSHRNEFDRAEATPKFEGVFAPARTSLRRMIPIKNRPAGA